MSVIAEDIELALAEHREALWQLGIRVAIVRVKSAHQCERSRWEAQRARRLLRQRVLRGVSEKSAASRTKRTRHRPGAFLVTV